MAERAAGKALRTTSSSEQDRNTLRAEFWDEPLRITECDCDTVGLRVTGAIDLNSHDDWEHALREVTARCDEVHLDLTDVTFIDVRGVTLLVDVANHLGDGQRIVVLGAPPGLQRVLQVIWPDGTAAITIKGEQ